MSTQRNLCSRAEVAPPSSSIKADSPLQTAEGKVGAACGGGWGEQYHDGVRGEGEGGGKGKSGGRGLRANSQTHSAPVWGPLQQKEHDPGVRVTLQCDSDG